MLEKLIELTSYEEYLKLTTEGAEARGENVKELITFATEVSKGQQIQIPVKLEGEEDADGMVDLTKDQGDE